MTKEPLQLPPIAGSGLPHASGPETAPATLHRLAEQYARSLTLREGLLLPTYAVSWGSLTPRQIDKAKRWGWRLAADDAGLVYA